MKKFGILFIVLVGIATTSFGQVGANATASASATIVGSLTLTKNIDLKFGQMTSPATAQTVVLTAAGVATSSDNAVLALIVGSPVSAAEFAVTGTANATYAITLPASTTLAGAGSPMTVDTFTTSKPGDVSKLSAVGADSFTVGATLHVGALQAEGVYAGTFQVDIAYN